MVRPRSSWYLSLGAVILTLAVLVTPLWVMRPFRAQGPTELALALGVLRHAPWLSAAAALLAALALRRAWPRGGWRRVGALAAALAVGAGAYASRINVFERIFHPLPGPTFAPIAASGLPGEVIAMTVESGGRTRAYPVEVMAYHHVLNDEVGGVPLVVTY